MCFLTMKVWFLLSGFATICVLVHGFDTTGQSWGYAHIRPKAHMFWWLYETTAKVESITDRPLLIWLQGGPGASSTGYGNFEELGPLDIDLKPRNSTWVKHYNVLFIDNPVGSGFSYVEERSALTTTNKEIALDLVACLKQFYLEKPEFENVPLYITAESYGGKMTIEFALELINDYTANGKKSNLKGVQLIDSWISPVETMLSWADYLYHLGVVDTKGYKEVDKSAKKTESLVAAGKWRDATNGFVATEYKIIEVARNIDFYNILNKVEGYNKRSNECRIIKPGPSDREKLANLMNGPVRRALNLDTVWGKQSDMVFDAQYSDFMKPVTHLVERALNETDIIVQVVTGQLDLIVATPGTVKWVNKLKWPKSDKWQSAPRNALLVNGYIEGYVKKFGKLALYWVNRSGHMVPADNIHAMRAILKDLTGI